MGWLLVHSNSPGLRLQSLLELLLYFSFAILISYLTNTLKYILLHELHLLPCLSAYSSLFSIAVYKALYKSFGGFAADVVAAVDQVCLIGLVVFH